MLCFESSMRRLVLAAALFASCAAPPPREATPAVAAPVDTTKAVPAEATLPPPPSAPASANPAPQDRAGLQLFRARPLAGCIYEPAREFADRYCAACHTSQGSNRLSSRASKIFLMDTFNEWKADAAKIPRRVDRDSLKGKIMPPLTFPDQPTAEERRLIVDWVKRGSPNTPDGK